MGIFNEGRRYKVLTSAKSSQMVGYGVPNREAMRMSVPDMAMNNPMTKEELLRRVSRAVMEVKTYVGVCNNAVYLILGQAMDELKGCKRYRQMVKKAFGKAMDAWKAYENGLVYARVNRMFSVADFTDQMKKRYGNITNREYYDFWCSVGYSGYDRTKDEMNVLRHKYRLAIGHMGYGDDEAKRLAWVMLALAGLSICESIYECVVERAVEAAGVHRNVVEGLCRSLSLQPVREAWENAVSMYDERLVHDVADWFDERNIEMALEALALAWSNDDLCLRSVMDSCEEYGEVFRTKGEQKKVVREIAELNSKVEYGD